MKEEKLVNVAIPRPFWNTFTYILPENLSGGQLQGCRVLVPFGKSKLVGFIWDDKKQVRDFKPRKIIARLDSAPLLPENVLRLVYWSAEYYKAPPGLMMSAAHPPGIAGMAKRLVVAISPVYGSKELQNVLGIGKVHTVDSLSAYLSPDYPVERKLAELEKQGIVQTWWEPLKGPRPRREYYLSAVPEQSKLSIIADSLRKKAPKQAEILIYFAGSYAEHPLREILTATGSSIESVRSLVGKGFLRQKLKEIMRDPLEERESGEPEKPKSLTRHQEKALSCLLKSIDKPCKPILLHGVTGSGKTEIYLQAIAGVLKKGCSALILVPEISLTPLVVSRFAKRFPGEVAVLHSGISKAERLDSWNMVRNGSRKIVIGARSAVFAPLSNPGLIIIDEEHDGSYKQNDLPRYNGRDLAVVRANIENVPVILGSACPSLESYENAVTGKYSLVELPERIDSRPMPVTRIISSGVKNALLSDELLAGIGLRTARSEQAIILVNRRGFSPSLVCRNCGFSEECPDCGIRLTYHKKGELLKCHHCSFWKTAYVNCPRCGNDSFSHLGPGIQKVEETLNKLLPQTRVIRMDSDTTRGRRSHWTILESFGRGEGDVLLGTQMVAKGHDFPNVTLVGVVAADMGLCFPDFRSAEKTFQLILQVAGRAGRGGTPGEVIVQAFDTENFALIAACKHDYAGFWKSEAPLRKKFCYPPFVYMVRFIWSGTREGEVAKAAKISCRNIHSGEAVIYDPVPAAMRKIRKQYRWNTIAKSESRKTLAGIIKAIRENFENLGTGRIRFSIDVDPYDMM